MKEQTTQKWYDRTGWILALCFLFPPAGLILLWRAKLFSVKVRLILTALACAWLEVIVTAPSNEKSQQKPVQVVKQASNSPAPSPSNPNANPQQQATQEVAITVPTSEEIKLFEELNREIDANFDSAVEHKKLPNEDAIMRRVAKKHGMTVDELINLNSKVSVYKESKGRDVKKALEAIVRAQVKERLIKVEYLGASGHAIVSYQGRYGLVAGSAPLIAEEWIPIINAVMEKLPDVKTIFIKVECLECSQTTTVEAASIMVARDKFSRPLHTTNDLFPFEVSFHNKLKK